jgi:hypothetical protein
VNALAVSDANIFAGTWGGGVFLSTNSGTSWTAVNSGLTNSDVRALAVSPTVGGTGGTNLIAGTWGSGVWRRPLSEMIISVKEPISVEMPSVYSLHQNYPNPFNPSTTIEFSIPQSGFVSIEVFNTLGQVVGRLVNEELQPGKYKTSWDASGFPSGTYFYRLQSGSFSETKKLILVR